MSTASVAASSRGKPRWDEDPQFLGQLADEACTILGLTRESRQMLHRYIGRQGVTEDDVRADGPALRALIDELLPALRRQGIRIELIGLSDATVERYLDGFLAGGEDPDVPEVLMPEPMTSVDRDALVHFIGRFRRRTRKRVFGSGSMMRVRIAVAAGGVALKRARKRGGFKARPMQPSSVGRVPGPGPGRTTSLIVESGTKQPVSGHDGPTFSQGMFILLVLSIGSMGLALLADQFFHLFH